MNRQESGHSPTYLRVEDRSRSSDGRRGSVAIRAEQFTSPAATALISAADAFNESLYGHPDQTPLDPTQFDPDRGGLFVVAYLDAQPVACGGFRRAEPPAADDAAEVKRMFVVESARRDGVGRQLLATLEGAARACGYHQVVLDVGAKQATAHQFYEAAGYHRIPGFSIYRDRPGNRAYAKILA